MEPSPLTKIGSRTISLDVLGWGAPLGALFRREGPRYVLVYGYVGVGALFGLARFQRRLRGYLKGLPGLARAGLHVDGYPLLHICRSIVEEHLRDRFVSYATFAEMCRSMVRRLRITHVVVNQDMEGFPKILATVGNECGFKTVVYQHGLSFNVAHIQEHVSKTVAVWGERDRELYRRYQQRSFDRIRVSGDPAVTDLHEWSFDRESICRRLGLDPQHRTVLWICERFVNWHSEYERETSPNLKLATVCEVVSGFRNVQLLARFKPDFGY